MKAIRSGIFVLLSTLTLLCSEGHAQNYTVSLLGKTDLRKANYFYKKKNYEEAVRLYSIHLSAKDAPLKAQLALAHSLKQLYRAEESETWYRKAFSNNKNQIPAYGHLDFVEVLIMNGKINEANEQVKLYLADNPDDEKATQLLRETSQYPSFYKDSLQYTIQPYFVNSDFSDYAPVYFHNDIVFCSSRPGNGIIKHVEASSGHPLSHLYVSKASSQSIDKFQGLNHASKHDGPATFWDKDTKAIYCSNSDELFENGKLTLLYSEFISETKEWSKPIVLPFIDPQYSYAHPSFDEANHTLYFASNISQGQGGTDIYSVEWKDNKWDVPTNLGTRINTSGDEMYPFPSEDGVLYFASNGHTGMGGLDIYASRTDSTGSHLNNLGHPVNSAFDDFSLVLSNESTTGFFSSNRTGNDDIFAVKIYRITLDIDISDQLNYKPLSKCIVKVSEQETGELKYILNTDKNGYASCTLIPGKNYTIKIYKNGYAMKSLEFAEYNREQAHVKKSIPITRTHQRYVKAKLQYHSALVGNTEVRLLDYSSDSVMTYKADSTGSFLCQINSDTTVLLYFKKDQYQGYAFFEKDEDARENSGITYMTITMTDSIPVKTVHGIYQSGDSTAISNATLYYRSRINRKVQSVSTDEKGAFAAYLDAPGIYDFYEKEDLSKAILTVNASDVRFLEITGPE